jgi:hypothetical protein
MKIRNKILMWAGAVCLIALAVYAANPSFSDFLTSQFSTANNLVVIKGAGLTNLDASNITAGSLADARLSANVPLLNAANVFTAINTFTGTTNAYLQATNIYGIKDSVCIPAGSFFSFNLLTPATNATFTSATNTSDAWQFKDSITNEIRARFALPWDWNGSTVQFQVTAFCTGTNHGTATNVVWAVAAAALGDGDNAGSPTFGTAIWVTNAIHTNSFIQRSATTTAITVGNNPAGSKSILWQVQRLGAQGGDTLTNDALLLTEARIFFTRNLAMTNTVSASP